MKSVGVVLWSLLLAVSVCSVALDDDIPSSSSSNAPTSDDPMAKKLHSDDYWDYSLQSSDSLQPISRFEFCSHLDGSYFDTDTRMNAHIVRRVLRAIGHTQLHFTSEDSNCDFMQDNIGSEPSSDSDNHSNSQETDAIDPETLNSDILPDIPESADEHSSDDLTTEEKKQRRMGNLFHSWFKSGEMKTTAKTFPIRNLLQCTMKRQFVTIGMLTEDIFTKFIDAVASSIVEAVLSHTMIRPIEREKSGRAHIHRENARRFACFMAADGNNNWARFIEKRRKLLRFVEGKRYFDGKIEYVHMNRDDIMLEAQMMQNGQMTESAATTGNPNTCPLNAKPLFTTKPLSSEMIRVMLEEQEKSALQPQRSASSSSSEPEVAITNHDNQKNEPVGENVDSASVTSFFTARSQESMQSAKSWFTESQSLAERQEPRGGKSWSSIPSIASSVSGTSSHSSSASSKSSISSDPMFHYPRYDLDQTRPHRLAYFLLVHKDFDQVIRLLSTIADRYTVILIHIDAKNPILRYRLETFLNEPSSRYTFRRVRIMKQSFNGLWGHASLVFAQLAGFFELLDISDQWDYVVNLSGQDFPLRHNDVIYDDIKSNFGSASMIKYWSSMWETNYRFKSWPIFRTTKDFAGESCGMKREGRVSRKARKIARAVRSGNGKLWFPFPSWKLYKHHQWMILSRKHVELLRSSPTAMYFLAYSEWTMIPDEGYFASIMLNNPRFAESTDDDHFKADSVESSIGLVTTAETRMKQQPPTPHSIVNDCKRLIIFPPAAAHPKYMEAQDTQLLKKAITDGVAYTRKVDIEAQQDLIRWLKLLRDRDRSLYWGENWYSPETKTVETEYQRYMGRKKHLSKGLRKTKRKPMPPLKEDRRREARAQFGDDTTRWWDTFWP